MKTLIVSSIMMAIQLAAAPLAAQTQATPNAISTAEKSRTDISYKHYQADYEVNADASSTKVESHEILLKTKAAVDQYSQVRLQYSESMQTLEVLSAHTLTAEGQRHDVPPDAIRLQESYASAAAAMHADHKVQVIVFPNLAPGARIVYQVRATQKKPRFPGLFDLWETYSLFTPYEDVKITLNAPEHLPLRVESQKLEGSDTPRIHDGRAHWSWSYQGGDALKTQTLSAPDWTFSPTLMASTYSNWEQLGKAYQIKSRQAAQVTPAIQALSEKITHGINDRQARAEAIYYWVAKNIRYVAVYLENGSFDPRSAQEVIDSLYGDCKDHVVALEALLTAAGIESSPVLISAGNGPMLPNVPTSAYFNHVITYLPEFDTYLESTTPWARFGQLPSTDRGAPALHTLHAKLTRTPSLKPLNNHTVTHVRFAFDRSGNLQGQTRVQPSADIEIALRGHLSQINEQNREAFDQLDMAHANIHGKGHIELHSDLFDSSRPLDYRYTFQAQDHVDFNLFGGMSLPLPPGSSSIRNYHQMTMAPDIQTPFSCLVGLVEEIYALQLPDGVPLVALPRNQHFTNAAGTYQVDWSRDGQKVTATHRLQMNAMRGPCEQCEAQDYPLLRELFQQVRHGFRGQLIYGNLPTKAAQKP